jgi:hypothetical protein
MFSSKEEFIAKAVKVHGDKYDYSLVEYVRSSQKIKIRCFKHGIFEQTPNSHLMGRGCCLCGRKRTIEGNSMGVEGFLDGAKKIHGNKYDYSMTKYIKNETKIDIICPKHGMFKQRPVKHLRGQGCPKCGREHVYYNQLSTQSFIEKSRKVHGDKYDYSLVDYIRSNSKVKIVCPVHGVFEQTPNNHIMGMKCIKCANEENGLNRTLSTDDFIKRSKEKHGDRYDYSETNYISSEKKLKIICRTHGSFMQLPNSHWQRGQGCPKCGRWSLLNTDVFKEKAEKVHGLKFDYSQVDYVNARTKVKIICPKHGIFEQVPQSHLRGSGCPICLESQGERKVALCLAEKGIVYVREKSFTKCRNKYMLFFDFYLPALNTCIEYDGLQHFEPVEYFGGEETFKVTQKLDKIKNNFCSNNGIGLVRISYKEKDPEIRSILQKCIGV